AEAAVRSGLESLDRMVGFRAPLGHLAQGELAEFRAQPPRPYVPGSETAVLGAGAELFPDVRYVGAVVELGKKGGVKIAVGDRVLPLVKEDAAHLRRWRSKPPEDNLKAPRAVLQIGDLI